MTAPACGALNPDRTFICDQPAEHQGDHQGPELPVVFIDDDSWKATP